PPQSARPCRDAEVAGLSRAASSSRGGGLVLPPRPGWRELARRAGMAARPASQQEGQAMPEPSVSFAGNLADQPEVRSTEGGIARAMFRVAVSGRRDQEASFFTVVVWRDQAEHAAESLSNGGRGGVGGTCHERRV